MIALSRGPMKGGIQGEPRVVVLRAATRPKEQLGSMAKNLDFTLLPLGVARAEIGLP